MDEAIWVWYEVKNKRTEGWGFIRLDICAPVNVRSDVLSIVIDASEQERVVVL